MATLKTKATLDRSDFDSGLESMKRATKQFDQSLGQTGGALAAVFGGTFLSGMVSGAISKISEVVRSSMTDATQTVREAANLHVPTEELEIWIDLFEKMGASRDDVTSLFSRIESAREKAIEGNLDLIKSFQDVGISLKDLQKMSNSELNRAFATGFSGGGSETAAEQIAGRGLKRGDVRASLQAYAGGTRSNIPSAIPGSKEALRDAEKSSSNFFKSFGRIWVSGLGTMAVNAHDTWALITGGKGYNEKLMSQQQTVKSEEPNRELEFIKAREKAAFYLADVKSETEKHNAAELKNRNEEISRGVRVEPMNLGGEARRGLIAGGGMASMEALNVSRRQVEVAYRQTMATITLTAAMKEATRHAQAMTAIEASKPLGLSALNAGQQPQNTE